MPLGNDNDSDNDEGLSELLGSSTGGLTFVERISTVLTLVRQLVPRINRLEKQFDTCGERHMKENKEIQEELRRLSEELEKLGKSIVQSKVEDLKEELKEKDRELSKIERKTEQMESKCSTSKDDTEIQVTAITHRWKFLIELIKVLGPAIAAYWLATSGVSKNTSAYPTAGQVGCTSNP